MFLVGSGVGFRLGRNVGDLDVGMGVGSVGARELGLPVARKLG